ncbi:papilin-like isoform X2 [Gouania willdenowi]|uniref:papilin-like isoform X2 n=1 Tax=Gouania willdenowi TaxID=441366 RepID=UPI001055D779|nr:papilin-like isoform X2 [Gouania willdenowi]
MESWWCTLSALVAFSLFLQLDARNIYPVEGVKPGECPNSVTPYVKPCADKCSNDYDCAFNEKCCYQGCGRTCVAITPINPNKPGECPKYVLSPYFKPCADKCSNDYDCAYNEKCCYQGCGRTCVAIQQEVKPGECPKYVLTQYFKPCANKCSNDYDCADHEKCCYQGCGRKCVPITPINPNKPGECPKYVLSPYFKPCADKCSNDYDCAYNEKCCYQGCGRTCVAIQQEVKPGECPKYVLTQYFKPCANKCSNDYDCADHEKCCYQGCGRKCVPITPINPKDKAGVCPNEDWNPLWKACPDKCNNDYDCPLNEKCCRKGCGRVCVDTKREDKPGSCPHHVWNPDWKPCADKCHNDYDCGYNEKCCRQGCGHECVVTTPIKPGVKPGECPKYVLTQYFKPCANKCSNDYDCADHEKCCYQGCGRKCVPITPINPNKPGECPKYVLSPYFKPCADKCSNDYDCAYNEKCCYQGCGRTCVAIQQEDKAGVCPNEDWNPLWKACPDKCNNDYDCPLNEKCCRKGCGRVCVDTKREDKPGSCPHHVWNPDWKPCADKCHNDYDCGYNEKCCRQGCGHECVVTTPIKPGVKPGECPKYVLTQYFKPCANKCSNDYDCADHEKCCYQGCGRKCVPITPINPRVKLGECPNSVQSPYFKPCADKCSNDYDCAYNEKCCYQGCGRTCVAITPINPDKPGECPKYVLSPYFKPCADKCSNDYDCAYNEKCCYQGCGRTCVAIQQEDKAGVCPNEDWNPLWKACPDKCNNDYDCPLNEKCCRKGCGRVCVDTKREDKPGSCPHHVWNPDWKPCADKCHNDYDCAYNEKCCRQGCGHECVAITPIKPGVKPGECPNSVPSLFFKPCADKCSNDYDCAYNEKCCYQGCGRTCVAITPINPRVNPGECPNFVPSPYFKPCADKCSNDYDCAYNEKCCYQGCGRTCVAIQQEDKAGVCPNEDWNPLWKACPDKCNNDYDCPLNEKCCRKGCGRVCVDTKREDKPGSCPHHVWNPDWKPCADKCHNDYDCAYNEKCCRQGCGHECVAITPIKPGVKPGECPNSVPSLFFKPCADKCSNDYDCAYNEKCCYQGCGRTCVAITPINPRVNPGECPNFVPSPYFKPCADKCSNDYDCAYNEKCCYQGCGRTCVAIQQEDKAGVCPNEDWNPLWKACPDKCNNDYDCPLNEKCCRKGCGRVCVDTKREDKPGSCPHHVWNPDWKPCADKCHNDYDCAYNEKCCRQGCGHECVAITPIKPGVKPGECPKYDLVPYFEPCADKCHNDYDCADHEKCCYHGCGRVCVAIKQEDKAGVCPYENWNPLWEACPDKCYNDYDCPHHEKCCHKGCGRVCVDTNHEDKPGSCPHHVWNPDWKPCADKCHNDYDCAYNEKCCRQGCGRVCVAITPIKPGVKPRECPKYDLAPYFEPCADKCYNDYDCAGHEKCCYHGCGRVCVVINQEDKAGVCPYENWNPLWEACPDKCYNDYDCPHHEKCCHKGCGRVCVDTNHEDKPGSCPHHVWNPDWKPCADKCHNDYDCAYNEKCCRQGCGRVCVAITPIKPEDKAGVCPNEDWNPLWEACPDKCHNDYDCPHHEKCCRKGCGRVCVDTNHVDKPGLCPHHVWNPDWKPCADKCHNDYDCAYHEKCCHQGCGLECVAITPIKPVKPGECPIYVLAPYFKPCADKCSNDYDCAHHEKCCYQGCGRMCVAIKQEDKPGSCPHHVWNPDWKPCADKCHNDYDCAYNEKCCRQGYGHECVVITPEVKPGACPKYVLAPLFKHCADKCSNDYDCPLNEKCCYQGCGRVCVTINQAFPW